MESRSDERRELVAGSIDLHLGGDHASGQCGVGEEALQFAPINIPISLRDVTEFGGSHAIIARSLEVNKVVIRGVVASIVTCPSLGPTNWTPAHVRWCL